MTLHFLSQKEQIALYLEDMYCKFGFHKYKVKRFEEYSFYMEKVNYLNDSRVITFSDTHGKLMALKPDVTMSIVKNCLTSDQKNQKIYYNESVFRIPKGEDEFKEIQQIGVEYIGTMSQYQTLEVLNLAAKSLENINENYRLCLSNLALLLPLFQDLNLNQEQINSIIQFLTQKNRHDLERYLEQEQIPAGDIFTKLLELPTSLSEGIKALEALFADASYQPILTEFKETLSYLLEFVPEEKVYLDFSHIPSTEYYQGLVFSGYIDGLALPVLVGGRYDNLIQKMGISQQSALGFAVDLSAVDKLFPANQPEVLEIQAKPEENPGELLKKANALFQEGQTFHITL